MFFEHDTETSGSINAENVSTNWKTVSPEKGFCGVELIKDKGMRHLDYLTLKSPN